ncbi:MAG: trimeric intracellular cation channel family protein [Thiofilum sp.]|uniref:trimeric intracellular cation channel family protein n=1 Tax=Thiofilum sp. TaxID=2212733 RepID=UPI0025FA2008|nr:trimeric intracellular cation channel family protein [Thiofilum sp.]MBK8453799.1 trimeric intracellular cation channel family protein [Thiofilum sp.]
MHFDLFIQVLNVIATVTLAISGVSQAARHQMDFFGALVLALVCALGGGTLRDMMIGATPVFWLTDLSYLWIILATTLLAIILINFIPTGRGIRARLLDVADAAGLALFAVLGAQKALQYGLPEPAAVAMGVVTGIAGGMIRDILTPTTPFVMRGEVYAIAAISGAMVYTLLRVVLPEVTAILMGMAVVFLLRLAAIFWQLKVPMLKFRE